MPYFNEIISEWHPALNFVCDYFYVDDLIKICVLHLLISLFKLLIHGAMNYLDTITKKILTRLTNYILNNKISEIINIRAFVKSICKFFDDKTIK